MTAPEPEPEPELYPSGIYTAGALADTQVTAQLPQTRSKIYLDKNYKT